MKLDDYISKKDELIKRYEKRNKANAMYDNINLMRWEGEPKEWGSYVTPVVSPSAHYAVKGATHLMTATRPGIIVPPVEDTEDAKTIANKMERYLKANLWASSRRSETPIESDLVNSALIYAEVCAQTAYLPDTLAFLEKNNSKAVTRYQRMISRSPFSVRIFHPNWVYPEYSQLGLEGVLLRYKRYPRDIRAFWGDLNAKQLPIPENILQGEGVWFNDYTDHEGRCIWVDDSDKPIKKDERDPDEPMNWTCRIVQGTSLQENEADKRQGFLFSIKESGMFDHESLALTMLFTRMKTIGANAQYNFTSNQRDEPPEVNYDILGGARVLREGEKWERADDNLVDDDLKYTLDLVAAFIEDGTMPKQVTGSPPPREQAFATTNALQQAGRLPMVPIQVVGGNALGDICEFMLEKTKLSGEIVEVLGPNGMVSLSPDEIPDFPVVTVQFKPDVHQDKQQVGNVVSMLTQSQIISKETGQEWLNIDDSAKERKRIFTERRDEIDIDRLSQLAAAETQRLASTNESLLSREKVNYRTSENAYERCDACQFFNQGRCDLVEGIIAPDAVCDRFAFAPKDNILGGIGNSPPQGGQSPALNAPGLLTKEATTQVDRAGNRVVPGNSPLGV